MKNGRFILSFLVLLPFASGCSSLRITQSPAVEPKPALTFVKEIREVAEIDLPKMLNDAKGKELPEIITALRMRVNEIVTEKNIDGLSFITDENTPGIIGHLVAEARLLKPYLVTAAVYKDDASLKRAEDCLKEGVVDLIVKWEQGKSSFPDRLELPAIGDIRSPRSVFGLDLSRLFPGDRGGKEITVNGGSSPVITDSEGKIGFISMRSDTIVLKTGDKTITLSTAGWSVPFRYALDPENKPERSSPWVEFRSMPAMMTDRPDFDILCKTEYPASVSINGNSVKQYRTGIFFDKVVFREGPNRVRATVISQDSLTAFYENEFVFKKADNSRNAFPLWINERTIDPSYDLELLPEDVVKVSFQGSLGQNGWIVLDQGKTRIMCSREDFADYSLYKGEISLIKLKTGKPFKIFLQLTPSGSSVQKQTLQAELKNSLIVREAEDFPYVRIARDNSRLVYNLGAPRLGGPLRAELGPGAVMKVSGKSGVNYRVSLSRMESGYINQDDVQLLPPGTVKPSYYITSMSCGPAKDGDILTIPWAEPVPYEVYPDPDRKRIVITLFGVETASTWITHLTGRKIIEKVTWEQTTPETYKIYVNIKTGKIWGYSLRPDGKRLVLRIRDRAIYDLNNVKPLTGLKIAIEAGHGGSGLGAVGLSGLLEKDVNLDLSLRLGELLGSMGAEIVQVRDSDKDMTLIEKRNIVIDSEADLFVSIHANAGGGGYLRVAGTSTYYNNPFWAPMAETIYNRLLELKLKEFGVVGSFNYTPIRLSEMPSILVEQAFMSNAEDEEKLADPLFRQQMAQKIYEGIIDYLIFMGK
jgi:N-acetylmuramoyl-L-alanine amidase